MMKNMPFKWLLLPLMTLLVTIGGLWLFLLTLDANDFKPQIESVIYDRSGIELSIEGPLQWSIDFNGLPSAALQLRDIEAYDHNASTTNERIPLARIAHLTLGVALKPLLNKTIDVQALTIDGLELFLKVDQRGQKNWQSTGTPVMDYRPTLSLAASKSDNGARSHGVTHFNLDRLIINNIQLRYENQNTQRFHQLYITQLQADHINLDGKSFTIKTEMEYQQKQQEPQSIQIELRSEISLIGFLQPSPAYPRNVTFRNLDMSLQTSSQSRLQNNSNRQTIALGGDGNYRLNDHAFVIDNFTINTPHSTVRLNVNGIPTQGHDQATPTIDVTGAITVSSDSLAAEAADAARWLGQPVLIHSTFEKRSALSLDAVISGQLDAYSQRLSLAKLQAELDGANIEGAVSALIKPGQAITLSSLLDIDRIDINRYLNQPEVTKNSKMIQQPLANALSNNTLPLSLLDRANLLLTTHVDTLVFQDITIAKIRSGIEVNNGDVTTFQITANALQSTFDIDAKLTRGQQTIPALSLRSTATDLDLNELLKSFATKGEQAAEPLFAGKIDVANDWQMSGNSLASWQASLTGESKASIQSGIFYADNIEHRICQAVAQVRQAKLSHQWPTFTALNQGNLVINWREGHGTITDVNAELDTLHINGIGSVDLSELTYSFDINGIIKGTEDASITGKPSDPACEVNAKYQKIEWPVSCRGYLNNAEPSRCRVKQQQLTDQLIELAKQQAKMQVKDSLKKKLGSDLNQLFKDRLEGLFK